MQFCDGCIGTFFLMFIL